LHVLSYCKNLPFIEEIEIDSDEEQLENVEETPRGDSNDELVIDKGEITEDSPGQGNVPTEVHRRVNEVHCPDEVLSFTDELWQYALDDFSTASISLATKQSAREFYQSILPQSSLSFHFQFVRAPFISLECSDPRVTKEILKCKVLTQCQDSSQCFSIQSTKVDEDESKRLLIEFSDVVGLEINGDWIFPTTPMRIRRKDTRLCKIHL